MTASSRPCRVLATAILCLLGVAGCATAPGPAAEWEVLGMPQVKRIAELRESMNEMRLGFRDVTIVRLATDGQKPRVDVTSIAPTIVSTQKDGAPAARTTFAMSESRDRMRLLTQDVVRRSAFYREIPMADVAPGKTFRFPVIQENGRVTEESFTVIDVVVR